MDQDQRCAIAQAVCEVEPERLSTVFRKKVYPKLKDDTAEIIAESVSASRGDSP